MVEFWRINDWSAAALHGSEESALAQGDLIVDCGVPRIAADFTNNGQVHSVRTDVYDLIVVTQSCDLANNKVQDVAMCPICSLSLFEEFNPNFKAKGRWEDVRKGRIEGLHLLGSPTDPDNNRAALVVDFGLIFSLPTTYLLEHAARLGERARLRSPFLEHFSQAFARFFMRVGLPSSIPPFR